ncbi:sulfotransferase family 2 domain-containing protein [Allosediminivita pacifica]|uniref:Sulfotransferase family protein n=1 Tax=Allosediminivita pacifica TaxID=1267769 RepID=A0A2T6AG34_9RHOB|nr:sulfotransferase family 2 domain-containing protein [Allosediminivita pacifica]PTX42764.1 sulfotransferase family protein [Allosediminivita pacifica]GGB06765.1 hypothetical protein GCM10011324_16090 [Allosediminivita pacifica]
MPFFKIDQRLVYYAHVPKCGGSSIAQYIRDRFGPLAFHESGFLSRPEAERWTKSSPQHVDAEVLERLIPLSFFDAVFTIVRHPVKRAVSTYHFQLELEQSILPGTSFSDWLSGLEERHARDTFAFDNHTRPMTEIVPEGATVFHMEHGLDSLVLWFDAVSGRAEGPRAILPENTRGDYVQVSGERVTPSEGDIAAIARIYAADFKRFGYVPDDFAPVAAAPQLDAGFLKARDKALANAASPVGRLRRKVVRRLQRL